MDKDSDIFKNFCMIIPKGGFQIPDVPPIPKWKKVICFLIGHHWEWVMVTTFEKTLPEKCTRCNKRRWLDKMRWKRRLIHRITKVSDVILRPLCTIGIHRWLETFRTFYYGIVDYGKPTSQTQDRKEEQHYACARCNKIKTIVLK